MAISWFPLQAGRLLTSDMINELVEAIQDGSVFTSVSFVSSLVSTLGSRVSSLEGRVNVLDNAQLTSMVKQQFVLTTGQNIINLTRVPILDSEMLFLNGMALAKSGVPIGYSADYSVSGNVITLVPELALQVTAGDVLVVNYSYNLP